MKVEGFNSIACIPRQYDGVRTIRLGLAEAVRGPHRDSTPLLRGLTRPFPFICGLIDLSCFDPSRPRPTPPGSPVPQHPCFRLFITFCVRVCTSFRDASWPRLLSSCGRAQADDAKRIQATLKAYHESWPGARLSVSRSPSRFLSISHVQCCLELLVACTGGRPESQPLEVLDRGRGSDCIEWTQLLCYEGVVET